MATTAQVVADLQATNAQLVKISGEITAVQSSVDALHARIAELEEIISNNGEVPQEVVDAVAAVKAQAQAVDEQIPDLPTPPTPEVPPANG